jgi:hypothetical protein
VTEPFPKKSVPFPTTDPGAQLAVNKALVDRALAKIKLAETEAKLQLALEALNAPYIVSEPNPGAETEASETLYYRAIEGLTCLVEHTEGLEECPSPAKVIRNAILFIKAGTAPYSRTDTIRALEVLAHRFEEIMDREDLDL